MENSTHWKQFRNSNYFVSDTGLVKSTFFDKTKLLATCDDGNGYLKVTLHIGLIQSAFKVHSLVAECFLEKAHSSLEVNHKDGNKLNNSVSNLEWISHADNMKHGWAADLFNKGEDTYNAVLTTADVIAIKKLFVEYRLNNTEIGDKFGVAKGTISKIRSKQTWKDVCPDLMYPPGSPDDRSAKKLCGADIPLIREFYAKGQSLAEIGRKFNVHSGTINGIVSGKTWKNY